MDSPEKNSNINSNNFTDKKVWLKPDYATRESTGLIKNGATNMGLKDGAMYTTTYMLAS